MLRITARIAAAAALAALISGCVERPTPAGVTAVDESFTPLTVRWGAFASGRTTVFARVERRGDDTVVCGALAQDDVPGLFAGETLDTLRRTELRHRDTRLLRDLHGFAGPRSPDAALCVISAAPWSEAFADPAGLRLGFVEDVRLDVSFGGGFGPRLWAAARVCPPGQLDC